MSHEDRDCEHKWWCFDWFRIGFRDRVDKYSCSLCKQTKDVYHENVYPQPGPRKGRRS